MDNKRRGFLSLNYIVVLVFGLIGVAAVAFPIYKNLSTTNFSATELVVWGTIGIFVLLSFLYGIVRGMGIGSMSMKIAELEKFRKLRE